MNLKNSLLGAWCLFPTASEGWWVSVVIHKVRVAEGSAQLDRATKRGDQENKASFRPPPPDKVSAVSPLWHLPSTDGCSQLAQPVRLLAVEVPDRERG